MRIDLFSKGCRKCFFFQEGNCILDKNVNFPCDMKVRKIQGISSVEFYLNYVTTKHLSSRAFYFSLLSVVISCLALIVNATKHLS